MFQNNKQQKQTVVLVGYGWGGHSFTEHIDIKKYDVKVISKTPSRFNQPYIIANMEPSFTDPPARVDLVLDEALSVKVENKELVTRNGKYKYDYLVLATGSEPNDFGIKGVKEHCLMFKTALDVEILKSALNSASEISVIGAGATGIELAFKLRSLGKSVKIVEAGDQILPGFSGKMRRTVLTLLKEADIALNLNTKIKSISQDGYETEATFISDKSVKIWTCGVKPPQFAREFMSPLKPSHQLQLKPYIYGIGDNIVGYGPPTAQNAVKQGKYLADLFNSDFASTDTYTFVEKGRVLDATTSLVVEYNNHVVTLPPLFRAVYRAFTN
jgi:NADH dehydrogenase FAD-containing subunit